MDLVYRTSVMFTAFLALLKLRCACLSFQVGWPAGIEPYPDPDSAFDNGPKHP